MKLETLIRNLSSNPIPKIIPHSEEHEKFPFIYPQKKKKRHYFQKIFYKFHLKCLDHSTSDTFFIK